MAQIPVVTRSPVETQPLPSVRSRAFATPESFGAGRAQQWAGAARATQGLAAHVKDIADREDERRAGIEARDATNKLRERIRDAMNRPDGYLSRRGQLAQGMVPQAQEEFNSIQQEIGSEIESRRAADLFNAYAGQIVSSHLDSVGLYETREREQYARDTLDASNEQAVQDAVAAQISPDKVAGYRMEVLTNATERAKLDGLDGVQTSVYVTKSLAAFDAKMIESYRGSKQYDMAIDYLDAHLTDVAPTLASQARAVLSEEKLEQDMFKTALDLETMYPNFWDRKQWALDNVKDAHEYEVLDAWLSKREAGRVSAKNARNEAKRMEAWNSLMDQVETKEEGWTAWTPPADLDPDDRRNMQIYHARALNAWAEGRDNPPTDSVLRYKLERMYADDPDAFSQLDLTRYFPYLAKEDRNTLTGWQRTWRLKGKEDAATAWKRAELQIGARVMDQWGITRDSYGNEIRARIQDTYMLYGYTEPNAKPPQTPQECEELFQRICRDRIYVDKIGPWNTNIRAYSPEAPIPLVPSGAQEPARPSIFRWGAGQPAGGAAIPQAPASASPKPQPARHARIPKGTSWNAQAGVWEVRHMTGGVTQYDPDTGEERP